MVLRSAQICSGKCLGTVFRPLPPLHRYKWGRCRASDCPPISRVSSSNSLHLVPEHGSGFDYWGVLDGVEGDIPSRSLGSFAV